MNHHQKVIIGLCFCFSFFACNNSGSYAPTNQSAADSTTAKFISSSAAVENGKDTTRKFIRTAEMKFKVKNVIQSTYDIEAITNRQQGFITSTNLASNIDNTITTPVSEDSSLETTYYTATNTITLRVPNTRLDSTLKEISKNIDYLDYRVIKAEDVALQILTNNLTVKRTAKNEERLSNAIDTKGKKLNETTDAEELLLNKEEETDNSKISNLSLQDQIAFSTVNLYLYQRQAVKRELISNYKNITAYEPGLGSRILESMKYGWDIVESIVIFLSKLWGVVVLGILAYLVYRKYKGKYKK